MFVYCKTEREVFWIYNFLVIFVCVFALTAN